MCGIAGALSTSPSPEETLPLAAGGRVSLVDAVSRLVGALGHRGPDGRGVERVTRGGRPSVVFGHTRLAILDLSPAGRQPMTHARTGNWITSNGEVYNYRRLREELTAAGAAREGWSSGTDTEVILREYARSGVDCLRRLRGMFAFALWDTGRDLLFLARDRLGIKPLYYYVGDGFFVFASEVRALLASGLVPRRLDPVALWEYLAYQSVPAPRTLVQGVRSLRPGHCLTVAAHGGIEEARYWDALAQASPGARGATAPEAGRRIGELLRESVALHLVSDVPVGAFLSGGVDSSAVVGLMRELGSTPRTFSVVLSEKAFDEARHARAVAARFKTDHSEILLTERDLRDQLADALAAMDQPTGDGVNTYVVARAVRAAGMKVALSGLGGDELFGGYPSFRRVDRAGEWLRLWQHVPASWRAAAADAARLIEGASIPAAKLAALVGSDGTLPAVLPLMRQVLSLSQRRALLTDRWRERVGEPEDPYVGLLRKASGEVPGAGPLTLTSYAEARTYMHDVLLRDTDQMSMAHALEVRVPLLDHELVGYVMGLPDAYKRPDDVPKRLLMQSLNGLVPEEIVQRPKQGFALPFDPWMRGALRPFCEQRLDVDRIAGRGIFQPARVRELWRAFLDGRRRASWARLWILVVLEDWLDRNGF
jgi:asparagine synthase (glutamine-hydrolysing)